MGNVGMGKFLKTLPITVCQYMGKYSTYAPPLNKPEQRGLRLERDPSGSDMAPNQRKRCL